MPFEREPIFHDRQSVISQASQQTSSLTFVDITGATLTTRDLGQPGNYAFWFTLIISASQAITTATFQITVNGTPLTGMERAVLIKTNALDLGITFVGEASGIQEGDTLQIQWATSKGTLTLSEFNLLMDGIPESRLINP